MTRLLSILALLFFSSFVAAIEWDDQNDNDDNATTVTTYEYWLEKYAEQNSTLSSESEEQGFFSWLFDTLPMVGIFSAGFAICVALCIAGAIVAYGKWRFGSKGPDAENDRGASSEEANSGNDAQPEKNSLLSDEQGQNNEEDYEFSQPSIQIRSEDE